MVPSKVIRIPLPIDSLPQMDSRVSMSPTNNRKQLHMSKQTLSIFNFGSTLWWTWVHCVCAFRRLKITSIMALTFALDQFRDFYRKIKNWSSSNRALFFIKQLLQRIFFCHNLLKISILIFVIKIQAMPLSWIKILPFLSYIFSSWDGLQCPDIGQITQAEARNDGRLMQLEVRRKGSQW